jgi:Class III cytochrome C family/Outer membrane cytochrome MtrC/MtrF-like, domains II/IV
MPKPKSFQLVSSAMIVFFILFPFAGQASIKDKTEKRPDIITIDLGPERSQNEMPGVTFLHGLHTQSLDQQCAACHDENKGRLNVSFIPGDQRPSMEVYHEKCIACHVDKKAARDPSGPMVDQCGACHVRNPSVVSSGEKVKFDKSLHFVHVNSGKISSDKVSSDKIGGTARGDQDNCSACHHQYDESKKELVYEKGEEESCAYCHSTGDTVLANGDQINGKRVKNIRQASHKSCVACHQEIKAQNGSPGPVLCAGCHDGRKQAQMASARLEKNPIIPRLKRNQPDQVLLTPWEKEMKDPSPFMPAVAFDHKGHEAQTQSCQSCHHDTLKKCSECHTPGGGEEKGGFVSLSSAMHSAQAGQSCMGCHKKLTTAPECAGCHTRMPTRAKKDSASCTACHNVQPDQYRTAQDFSRVAAETVSARSQKYTKILADKIPETVVIEDLSAEYEPSRFPHGKVVRAILEKTEKSSLAKTFHRNQAGLCMGCHHNSPGSLEPPKCGSCHDTNYDTKGPVSGSDFAKPSLKGAFHGQCITCHQEMKVTQVLATDCVKCHELKK